MIMYILALIPLYMLVYVPLTNLFYGTPIKTPPLDISTLKLNTSFIATNEPLSCPSYTYTTHILSLEPLIIYIENFLSEYETIHLLNVSESKYTPSTISHGSSSTHDRSIRSSEVALLDRDDTVRCIEHRARDFQGWSPNLHIERLRTQRYHEGGFYRHHYDWSGGSVERGVDRVSTFLVMLEDACEGGGTEFPRLKRPVDEGMWCRFLECGEETEGTEKMGLVFKPVRRNAVFWVNLRSDGRGYEETWHAGLSVKKGVKVGLNIWSWGRRM